MENKSTVQEIFEHNQLTTPLTLHSVRLLPIAGWYMYLQLGSTTILLTTESATISLPPAESTRVHSGYSQPDMAVEDALMPDDDVQARRPPGSSANDKSLPSVTVRDYFPETWLWDLITTK